MTHLTLTAEQYRAHQSRVHGCQPRGRQGSPENPAVAPAKPAAASDRWPIVLRDQIVAAGLPEPYREHCFHASRGWRLDLAWPDLKAACEVDGMVHRIKGRFLADIERHNELVLAGWRWIRVTPRMVETGEAMAWVRRLIP